MACLWWYLSPTSSHQLKKLVKVGPPQTKLFGSAHVTIMLMVSLLVATVQVTLVVFMKYIFGKVCAVWRP